MLPIKIQSFGGRGASSGISVKGKKYGTGYHTLYKSGNIKFVTNNEGSTTAPMETMTQGRIYVTIDNKNEIKYISFYGKGGKRTKQIDVKGQPHTHKGYMHNEHGTNVLQPSEKNI